MAALTLGDQSWCHQRQFLRTVYPRILKRGDGKYKTYHHMGKNNFLEDSDSECLVTSSILTLSYLKNS